MNISCYGNLNKQVISCNFAEFNPDPFYNEPFSILPVILKKAI